jgi:hypothetical protein
MSLRHQRMRATLYWGGFLPIHMRSSSKSLCYHLTHKICGSPINMRPQTTNGVHAIGSGQMVPL